MKEINLQDLKIFKKNSVYRISDVVRGAGNRWEQDRETILTDPLYRDSILCDYLKLKKQKIDYECLKSVIKIHTLKKKYKVPAPKELVFHLRLGDYLDHPSEVAKTFRLYENFFKKEAFDFRFSRVTVVTALHFGHDDTTERVKYLYTEKAKSNSLKLLKNVEQEVNQLGYSLHLYSNENIDKDFCYLVNSKFLAQGHRGFSSLAAKCLDEDCTSYKLT